MSEPITVERALGSWQSWQSAPARRPEIVAALPGGRVNQSYLIGAGQWRAVLRINSPNSRQLGIDRSSETAILRLLADQPYVAQLYFSSGAYMVSEYIEGRQWTESDWLAPRQQQRLGQLIASYSQVSNRSASATIRRYGYGQYCKHYLDQLPGAARTHWQPLLDLAEQVDRQLDSSGRQLVHHDLSAANIIEADRGLVILDWEYAGFSSSAIDRLSCPNYTAQTHDEKRLCSLIEKLCQLWEQLSAQ